MGPRHRSAGSRSPEPTTPTTLPALPQHPPHRSLRRARVTTTRSTVRRCTRGREPSFSHPPGAPRTSRARSARRFAGKVSATSCTSRTSSLPTRPTAWSTRQRPTRPRVGRTRTATFMHGKAETPAAGRSTSLVATSSTDQFTPTTRSPRTEIPPSTHWSRPRTRAAARMAQASRRPRPTATTAPMAAPLCSPRASSTRP
ncbi:MAG: hypothetical protein QOG52_1195 [Frankiaceae bacterium]|nr:hypothetical protein [Frankiaceae bacterium]